jgi:hypothetical protein
MHAQNSSLIHLNTDVIGLSSSFSEVESWHSTALSYAEQKRLVILKQEPSLEDTPAMNLNDVAM